ncbi:MAG: T9SS type A sorting domain-containing protein, partial [Candidatus Latescibacteria bacterium]|nr:T9SS type A sorting domain-containing protein [Candidatus Latescibacterota bacterium]
ERYDVRGPTSSVSNRPGTRVTDVATQLNGNYKKIVWDAGDITQSLGDGTGAPEKSNDYAMVNTYLGGGNVGVYICGDDYPTGLNTAAGASAVTFKSTYITYTLTTGDHRPSYGLAPIGTGAGGAFGADTWVIYGGCALINDFDVVAPTGSSVMESTYGANVGTNGAEISKVTAAGVGNSRVMISGYSFIYIRDDEEDGVLDRSKHLFDILTYLQNDPDQPTDAKPVAVNNLEQNYPNPFNPQTTIAFSIKDRARVKIDVYNVAGELVKTLLDETRAAGSYTDVRWDGTNGANQPVSSGVYFYKLVSNNFSQTKKMVLLK